MAGITGGVASGKSTVAEQFGRLGAARIDADEIAHTLLAPGNALTREVIEHFGPDFALDGAPWHLDRQRLGKLVFSGEAARRDLNAIVHPPIHAELARQIETARRGGATLVVAEIPLLFENRLEWMVDRIIVAACTEQEQVRRLVARKPGLAPEQALAQIRSQMPIAEKLAGADDVIDTGNSRDAVSRQVTELFESLRRPNAP